MSAVVLPAHRPAQLRTAVAVALALLLLVGAPPTAVGAQPPAPDDAVSVELSGLDELVTGVASPVRVTVRVDQRGALLPHTPLRLLASLDSWDPEEEGLAVALATDDGPVDLDIDDDGRFVFPSVDGAPLTLAGTPALGSAEGHTLTLLVTADAEEERELEVRVAASNERSAAVQRRSGSERAATAAAISEQRYNPGVPVAYVTRADAFPDALAAGPVAGLAGGPILLTQRDALPAVTVRELQRLRPARIVALGGAAAISAAVLASLDGHAAEGAERLSGADRFGTAAAIALEGFEGPVDTVYIATGTGFADALSGGPAAAKADAPLLLVARDTIPAPTAAALRALRPRRIVVLGGSAAVTDAVVGRLGALAADGVTRHAGADRFATSAAVSRRSFEAGGVTTAYLATGANVPDSLAGAPAAALDGAPLLLVTREGVPAPVATELQRLRPGVVVLLGGTGVVGPGVADTVAAMTRTIAPDPDRFQPLATAWGTLQPGGELVVEPLDPEGPASLRPGQRFDLQVTAPRTGDYVVEHRPAGASAWSPLRNLAASGELDAGLHEIGLNAPSTLGAFDLRFRWVLPTGTQQEVVLPDALITGIQFRPPLFSSLMEGVGDQTQVITVSPVDGLAEGVRLDADLSDGAVAGIDYAGATLVQTHGSGTARLVRNRPADLSTGIEPCRVCIEYSAGPDDLHTEGAPGRPAPIIGFRLEGVDAPDVHESFVGRFFRYDAMHGVRWTFSVGAGGAVASPQLSDLEQGNDHQPQIVSFALPGRDNAVALEPFESVVIDLSEAEQGAVDYADASAFVMGGGHGHDVAPNHEPPGLGDAWIDVVEGEEAHLVFTAGPDGVAGASPEGPLVQVFIAGVATEDEGGTYTSTFTRSDSDAVSSTSFDVRRAGLVDAAVTDLAAGQDGQEQRFEVTIDGEIDPVETIVVDLSSAQAGAVDYTAADVAVTSGSGSASVLLLDDEYDGGGAALLYAAGEQDGDGSTVVLQVSGIATADADETHAVPFWRAGSGGGTQARFDVGAGSSFISPTVGDLDAGQDDTFQYLSFGLVEDLLPGQTLTIDLSEAEAGGAGYGGAFAMAYDDADEDGGRPVAIETTDGVAAVLRYTADAEGIPAGSHLFFDISGVVTEAVEASYTVTFARDGDDRRATAGFAIRAVPTLRNVSATDLDDDAIGLTQTLRATVVEDLMPGEMVAVQLSSAEQGLAAYGGVRLSVNSEASGTARLEAYRGDYAELIYRPGPEGDPDGTELVFTLRGINTDPGDETHAADFVRSTDWEQEGLGRALDRYSERTTLFDIGGGGPFVGRPEISSLHGGHDEGTQWGGVRLVDGLAAGEQVVVDLSAAQAGVVDYADAQIAYAGRGSAELVVDGDRAVLTWTAGPGGLRPGAFAEFGLEGVAFEPVEAQYPVTFTIPGATATASMWVFPDWGHDLDAGVGGLRAGARTSVPAAGAG